MFSYTVISIYNAVMAQKLILSKTEYEVLRTMPTLA